MLQMEETEGRKTGKALEHGTEGGGKAALTTELEISIYKTLCLNTGA